MEAHLQLRITYDSHQCNIPISVPVQGDLINVKVSVLLNHLNTFLKSIKSTKFLAVYVNTPSGLKNIYHLKDERIMVPLKKQFYPLYLTLKEDSSSLIQRVQQIKKRKEILDDSLLQLSLQHSRSEEERYGKEKRLIDVAYMFASPLVQIKGATIYALEEVSYVHEYNKFINMMKHKIQANCYVMPRVANETNIISTLNEGVSILHFACHGLKNILQIEADSGIGQIGRQFSLNTQGLKRCLSNSPPRMIIFNACHSHQMAKEINRALNITTIGYEGEAKQSYCAFFTQHFYNGIFKERKVKELFEQIKQMIETNFGQEGKIQAAKLKIFLSTDADSIIKPFAEQAHEWEKIWDNIEDMEENEPIGIKKEMYDFIVSNLAQNERTAFVLLRGAKATGKHTLMRKLKMYTKPRNLFAHELWIDCICIHNVLQFKLTHLKTIQNVVMVAKNSSKNIALLMILGHCSSLVQYQFEELLTFLKKMLLPIKTFRVVLIADQSSYEPSEAVKKEFKNNLKIYTKKPFRLDFHDLKVYMERFSPEQLKIQSAKILTKVRQIGEGKSHLFIQALRSSKTFEEFNQRYSHQEDPPQEHLFLDEESILLYVHKYQSVSKFVQKGLYKLEVNDYLNLSTILLAANPCVLKAKREEFQSQSAICSSDRMQDMIFDNQSQVKLPDESAQEKIILNELCSYVSRNFKGLMTPQGKMRLNTILKLGFQFTTLAFLRQQGQQFQRCIFEFETLWLTAKHYCCNGKWPCLEICSLINRYKLLMRLALLSYLNWNLSHFQQQLQASSNSTKAEMDARTQIELKLQRAKDRRDILLEKYQQREKETSIYTFVTQLNTIDEIMQQINSEQKYKISETPLVGPFQRQAQDNSQQIELEHKKVVLYRNVLKKIMSVAKAEQSGLLQESTQKLMRLGVLKLINRCIYLIEDTNILNYNEGLNLREKLNQYCQILRDLKGQAVLQEQMPLRALFKEFTRVFIYVRAKVEKQCNQLQISTGSLKRYKWMVETCKKYKFVPLQKFIEEYIQQMSFQNCVVLIAMPLLGWESESKREISNALRHEVSIERFLSHLFSKQIKKEIHYEVHTMTRKTLSKSFDKKESTDKNVFMYLLVCDCKESSGVIHLEDEELKRVKVNLFPKSTSKLELGQSSQHDQLQLPSAPIVVCFGEQVTTLKQVYRSHNYKNTMYLILIDTFQQLDYGGKGNPEILSHIVRYQSKEIVQKIFEEFYSSFCKTLFNQMHTFFEEQVVRAFSLAKAEALLQAKNTFYDSSVYIKSIIQSIELIPLKKGLDRHPSPSFMDNSHNEKLDKLNIQGTNSLSYESKLLASRKESCMEVEIGNNEEVCSVYASLLKLRHEAEGRRHHTIHYSNEHCKQFFLSTLTARLRRNAIFEFRVQISTLNKFIELEHVQESHLFIITKMMDYIKDTMAKDKLNVYLIIEKGGEEKQGPLTTLGQKQAWIYYYAYWKLNLKHCCRVNWMDVEKQLCQTFKNRNITFENVYEIMTRIMNRNKQKEVIPVHLMHLAADDDMS